MSASVPVGGSTGLDHESTAQIDQAVLWLKINFSIFRRPLVSELRARFGLTTADALQAIYEYKSSK